MSLEHPTGMISILRSCEASGAIQHNKQIIQIHLMEILCKISCFLSFFLGSWFTVGCFQLCFSLRRGNLTRSTALHWIAMPLAPHLTSAYEQVRYR